MSVVPCYAILTKWEVLDKHNFDYYRTFPTPQGSRPTRGLTKLARPPQRTLATTTMSSLPTPPLSTTSLPTPCQLTNTSQPTLPSSPSPSLHCSSPPGPHPPDHTMRADQSKSQFILLFTLARVRMEDVNPPPNWAAWPASAPAAEAA